METDPQNYFPPKTAEIMPLPKLVWALQNCLVPKLIEILWEKLPTNRGCHSNYLRGIFSPLILGYI